MFVLYILGYLLIGLALSTLAYVYDESMDTSHIPWCTVLWPFISTLYLGVFIYETYINTIKKLREYRIKKIQTKKTAQKSKKATKKQIESLEAPANRLKTVE